MATTAWVAIGSITLDSTAASVTFGSIPATYRDLVLVVDCEATSNLDAAVRYNGDTGSNYSYVLMRGASSGTFSGATGSSDRVYLNTSALSTDNRGTYILQVMDYSATDKHKTSLHRTNYNDTAIVGAFAARWANTNAITSLEVFANTSSFKVGSTFTLYGSNRL